MNAGKLTLYSIAIAVLAYIVIAVTSFLATCGLPIGAPGLAFVAVLGWGLYFLAGATVEKGVRAFLSVIGGIVIAIIIFCLFFPFAGAGMDVGYVALPLAVAIGVFFLNFFEKIPYFDMVAVVIMGAGTYFSIQAVLGKPASSDFGEYFSIALVELIYILVGFIAGWLTVQIRGAIEKSGE